MLLTGIAKQIEAQTRARARRYEAEYLANIFGRDYELPMCVDTAPGGASKRVWEVRARKAMPLFEDILSAVGEATHITPAQMRGRSRRQRIAYARQLAMYLTRQITRTSYPLIGAFFGRRHATVIYACESMRWRLPFDAEGRRTLDKIATIFGDRRRQLQQDGRNE
jgi:Bacterial dnaA protein helix-turn-helix